MGHETPAEAMRLGTSHAALQARLRTKILHGLKKQKSSPQVTERTSLAIQEKGEAPSELLKAQPTFNHIFNY